MRRLAYIIPALLLLLAYAAPAEAQCLVGYECLGNKPVESGSPANGEAPIYNSSTGQWEWGSAGGGASTLADLTDVTITTVATGETLVYTGAGWENQTLAEAGLQAQDAFLDDIAALVDPNADTMLFWDDSAGIITWLTVGDGLTITDTTVTVDSYVPSGGNGPQVKAGPGAKGANAFQNIDQAGSGMYFETDKTCLAANGEQIVCVVDPGDIAGMTVLDIYSVDRATPADNDGLFTTYYLENSIGTMTDFAGIEVRALDVTDATEDGQITFSFMLGGTRSNLWYMNGSTFSSSTSDGAQLIQTGQSSSVPSVRPNSGDTNTGLGGDGADTWRLISGGTIMLQSNNLVGAVYGTNSGQWRLMNENANYTNPVFVPDGDDTDTGVGWGAANALVLIAGGDWGLIVQHDGVAPFLEVQEIAAAPLSPQEGYIYANSGDNNLYYYDGTGWVDLTAGAGGGLSAVVDDTTPQLGGFLDLNGKTIQNDALGDVASGTVMRIDGPTRAVAADNDEWSVSLYSDVDDGLTEMNRWTYVTDDVTTATEDSHVELDVTSSGALTTSMIVTGTGIHAGATTSSAHLRVGTPSSTSPKVIPNNSDTNTGIGWAAADQLSLIAGGEEFLGIYDPGDAATGTVLTVHGPNRATAVDNDNYNFDFYAESDLGTQAIAGRINWAVTTYGGAGTENGYLTFYGANNSAVASVGVSVRNTGDFLSTDSTRFQIVNTEPGAATPIYLVGRSDANTGLGRGANNDELALVAGGVDVLIADHDGTDASVVIDTRSAVAASPVEGWINAISSDNTLQYYNGSDWDVLNDTETIHLSPSGAVLDATVPPASGGTNYPYLGFDATADEIVYWTFRLPDDYASGATLKVQYSMASATTGNVVWVGEVWAVTPGDAADIDTESYATANSTTDAVPATAGYLDEINITLTNFDSAVAGDWITIRFSRDANNASDTATGDAELRTVSFVYSK